MSKSYNKNNKLIEVKNQNWILFSKEQRKYLIEVVKFSSPREPFYNEIIERLELKK